MEWLSSLAEQRIPEAQTKAALTLLRREVDRQVNDHRCTESDAGGVIRVIDEREAELAQERAA